MDIFTKLFDVVTFILFDELPLTSLILNGNGFFMRKLNHPVDALMKKGEKRR